MIKITVDTDLRNKLYNFTQPLEFCDEAGHVLARMTPAVDLSEWEPVTPDISEDELARREQNKEKRYTTTEVLA
jgi:hypothetical protein